MNLNNVFQNIGGSMIDYNETQYRLYLWDNPVASRAAAVTCGDGWAFIDSTYRDIPANDHGSRTLAYSSGTISQCWKVRMGTPGITSYHQFNLTQWS